MPTAQILVASVATSAEMKKLWERMMQTLKHRPKETQSQQAVNVGSHRSDTARTWFKASADHHKKHAKDAIADMTGENAELMGKPATNIKS